MIVSVTPDLALDEGFTYAGGLGVLEGDKLYAAAKLNLPYRVLTLFYSQGYVDYSFDEQGNPIPAPQPQPESFLKKLKSGDTFTIRLKSEAVKVEALRYQLGSAEAVFFKPIEPEWAKQITERLYIERSLEEKFLKYTLLAKSSAEYIKSSIGIEKVEYIDLQESYACMLPLILKIPGRYRLVIHTAGPWGHPTFPRSFFEGEFGYYFISDNVSLTEIGLAASHDVFAVSARHFEQLTKIIPHFLEKLRYVTNGISVERWMDPELRARFSEGDLHIEDFLKIKKGIRRRFVDYLQRFKSIDVGERMIVAWCRRLTGYKRPEFAKKVIEDTSSKDAVFVLAGKPHPHEGLGIEYLKTFHRMHKERENVVFIPNYTVQEAKEILRSIDLLLFTPLYGLEACGTSYMKAAINGVPTLSTRDGGVVEFVVDDVNGWFFDFIPQCLTEPTVGMLQQPERFEYDDFRRKLQYIIEVYKGNPEKYYKVSLNALSTFAVKASVERALSEYYHRLAKIWR
ncbi:MAG: glycogen/starch/alpha-glucan phosphorylase [Nitrososphaerales archaeon]